MTVCKVFICFFFYLYFYLFDVAWGFFFYCFSNNFWKQVAIIFAQNLYDLEV